MDESDKKMFLILLIICIGCVIAALPYVLTTQGEILGLIPIPLSLILPLQIVMNGVQLLKRAERHKDLY